MLKEANDGETATLEEMYRSMINYTCVMLNTVNIHVHETVKDDVDRKVDTHDFVRLEGDALLADADKAARYAWDQVQDITAAETLTRRDLARVSTGLIPRWWIR